MSDPPGWWFVSLLVAERVSEFFGCRHAPLAPLQLCWLCLTNGFCRAFNAISSYPAQATLSTWVQRSAKWLTRWFALFSTVQGCTGAVPYALNNPIGLTA